MGKCAMRALRCLICAALVTVLSTGCSSKKSSTSESSYVATTEVRCVTDSSRALSDSLWRVLSWHMDSLWLEVERTPRDTAYVTEVIRLRGNGLSHVQEERHIITETIAVVIAGSELRADSSLAVTQATADSVAIARPLEWWRWLLVVIAVGVTIWLFRNKQ